MKILIILAFSLIANPSEKLEMDTIIYATYQGHDSEYYHFKDDAGKAFKFTSIKEEVSGKYDMDSEEHVGKMFKVTYTTEPSNANKGESFVILDLELPM